MSCSVRPACDPCLNDLSFADNIEYNVSTIATNTGAADRELVSASDYQRRAGRRAACLLLIVGFVIAVVLLAVSAIEIVIVVSARPSLKRVNFRWQILS